ncbi:MAG: dicarboxylate/amino acid:cation symporter [Longimicrobiales bacterium]
MADHRGENDRGADAFEREVTTDLDDRTADRPKRMPLHTRILVGLAVGAVAGITTSAIFGSDHPTVVWIIDNITDPIGQLFLRLLLMIVIPLVFSALVVGVAGVGDVRQLGRIGLKTFLYTLIISGISVVIGLSMVNLIQPGQRVDPATAAGLEARYGAEAEGELGAVEGEAGEGESVLTQVIETLIPSNPFAAAASDTPDLLHLMFFALVIGLAATLVSSTVVAPFIGFLEGLYLISAKIIDGIMKLAPYAVACLLFSSTAGFGLDLLSALAWFIATVLLGLGIHMLVVYSASVYFLSALAPMDFFRRVKTAMLTAFSTSSSNATLPTALRVSEENLGVPREINSFVLTVGATANQNGTALYEGVTIIFLAQLAGLDLGLGEQLGVAYLAILGGIGTAGVPGGSIPFIVLVLVSLGMDPALIAIILGVDRILDMCRTTLNVTGDITAATYIARSEGYPLLGELRPPSVHQAARKQAAEAA